MEVCYNGAFYPSGEPLLTVDNRSYKWGDGFFETIKVLKGEVLLSGLHFERVMVSMKLLGINSEGYEESIIIQNILQLCHLNQCLSLARIRLSFFRTENNKAGYCIEAMPLTADYLEWNEPGLKIGLYPFARKAVDAFSNIKTASFLPYVLASLYASEHGFDDALILNAHLAVADSSRANLFIVNKGELFTPSLQEGCINGVMRRYLLEESKKRGITIFQKKITEKDLLDADELFLTNAIQGIRWVSSFKEKKYTHERTYSIYKSLLAKP